MDIRRLTVCAAAGLLSVACTSTINSAEQVPASAAPAERLAAVIKASMAEAPFPGAAVAVSRQGKVIYEGGFGVADREANVPVTPETRFPIGSITKTITCLSVLQLASRGKVDLDAPVGRYLADVPEPSRRVSIRQLLTHSAGIPNYLENRDFPYSAPVGLSRRDMLAFFAAKPLNFPPGSQFDYSNSNTYLLGLVIEAVSGRSYDRYVAENVFVPFGMAGADFGANADRAKGYQSRAGAYRFGTLYDWLVPFSAGAIVSRTGDLLAFADGLFGKATSEEIRRLGFTGTKLGDGSSNAYLPACLVEGDLDGRRKYSHAGSIFGYSSHFAYYPDDQLTIVVLTNSQGEKFPALTLEHRIARIFLGLPEPDLTDRPLPIEEGAWVTGDYNVTNRRLGFDKLGFVADAGVLHLMPGGIESGASRVPLIRLGEGRFVSSADPEQHFLFSRNAAGRVRLTMRYYEADFPMRKL